MAAMTKPLSVDVLFEAYGLRIAHVSNGEILIEGSSVTIEMDIPTFYRTVEVADALASSPGNTIMVGPVEIECSVPSRAAVDHDSPFITDHGTMILLRNVDGTKEIEVHPEHLIFAADNLQRVERRGV